MAHHTAAKHWNNNYVCFSPFFGLRTYTDCILCLLISNRTYYRYVSGRILEAGVVESILDEESPSVQHALEYLLEILVDRFPTARRFWTFGTGEIRFTEWKCPIRPGVPRSTVLQVCE
ncbi:hypothetical protein RvY_10556-1 [Ramazzottius varieornatus]|uniref:Uncharacterized protein n=1 Tax=Ramazzottius varieornatus TaxID=947166 RepID=A0A1D1VD54_RAMVA|nr:hypothetical protein RvY_10556-1 [Ramazzottius varieornatus]